MDGIGSFFMGPLVDRFAAKKLFPFVLIPYAMAMAVAALNTHPFAAPAWFFLAGASFGCMTVTMSSLWAEAFGIESLGAISSLVGAAGVFASAISPFLFGWMLDHGLTIDHLFLSGAFLTVCVSLLDFLHQHRKNTKENSLPKKAGYPLFLTQLSPPVTIKWICFKANLFPDQIQTAASRRFSSLLLL